MLRLQKVAFSVDSLRLVQSLSKKLKGGFKKKTKQFQIQETESFVVCVAQYSQVST